MDKGLWQPVSVQYMSADHPECESMSLEEATISKMWGIAAIVEVFERKKLCSNEDSSGSGETANHSPCQGFTS